MISFKCVQRRLLPIDKWFLVLYVVFAVVLVSITAADGLSTTNERGMYSFYTHLIWNKKNAKRAQKKRQEK